MSIDLTPIQCAALVRQAVFGVASSDGADTSKKISNHYPSEQARAQYIRKVYQRLIEAGVRADAAPPPDLADRCADKSYEWLANEIGADVC